MNSAPIPNSESVWFQRQNYAVVPLNLSLRGGALKLQQAIEQGVYVKPDPKRPYFYDVRLSDGWGYIRVRDEAQAVDLIAYAATSNSSLDESEEGEAYDNPTVYAVGYTLSRLRR